jgi:hypothetical protein
MWIHFSLSLLMQVTPLSGPPLAASSRPTSVTEAAAHAVIGFLATWRTAWLSSAERGGYDHDDIRLRDVHCHWDGSFRGADGSNPPSVIHRGSRRSMCPNWHPAGERPEPDERVVRDASLTQDWRDRVHQARAALIDSLAVLDGLKPGDAWITGQRVRFLVDQGSAMTAVEVARRCSAERAWCAQLLGFALHATGDHFRADSAFDAASAAMSPKDRCKWTSVELLLDKDGGAAYRRMSCDERIAANSRIWWMSRPMFSDSTEDRRSEDFTRKVLIQLHSALPWDERYDWRRPFGGEAVSAMIVRYGWPAFSAYTGDYEEESHASWMEFHDSTRTATAEYPQDRVHLVPEWTAVADPFHAAATAWQLNMPPLRKDDEPASQWWPGEHYAPARGGIAQMRDQTVLLRRDDHLVLATASDLRFAGQSISADTAAAVLIRTTSPDQIERLSRRAVRNATALVLTARISAAPAVVGTEVLAPPGELSLRTRFGIMPPATLSELKPGETAISDPVLISTDDTPNGPDDALGQMLGTTVVRTKKVGVYWETYGYGAGDSVDVSVIVARREPLSKFRRLGMKLRVASDINGSVAVRWSEPQAGHDSWTIPSRVPIQARAVGLDLSRLEPGRYRVQVLAGRRGAAGAPTVMASRDFVLEKP